MKQFNEFLYENEETDFFETAACLGIVCGKVLINDINEFLDINIENSGKIEKISNEISKLLKKPYDWNKRGVSGILSNLDKNVKNYNINKNNPVDDTKKKKKKKKQVFEIKFIETLNLILGMWMFVDKEVKIPKSKRNFIHNRIKDYYKAEKKALGVKKGSKDNTSDCVIINTGVDEFLEKMITKPISSKEGFYSVDTHFNCYQISLKKSEGGAQLGKVLKKLKWMKLFEGVIYDKIKKVSKKVWSSMKKAMKSITSNIISKFKKNIDTDLEMDILELNRLIGGKKGFFSEGFLNESILNEKRQPGEEVILDEKTQKIVDSMYENKDNMLKEVNKNLKKIDQKSNENIIVKTNKIKSLDKFKSPGSVFKLTANFSITKVILNLVDDSEKINEYISVLIKEMLFGGTELPLWKVYGKFGSSKPYSYLGTVDTYNKDGKIAVETIGIRINEEVGSHYIINLYFFDYMDDENKYYVMLRTGTNSASRFSCNIEGTGKISIPLDSTLKSFINKEK